MSIKTIPPKATMTDICLEFQFSTRHGKNKRPDIEHLKNSLSCFKDILKEKYDFDLDNIPQKRSLPYPVIVFIYKEFTQGLCKLE